LDKLRKAADRRWKKPNPSLYPDMTVILEAAREEPKKLETVLPTVK
jgi:hypothetical protein